MSFPSVRSSGLVFNGAKALPLPLGWPQVYRAVIKLIQLFISRFSVPEGEKQEEASVGLDHHHWASYRISTWLTLLALDPILWVLKYFLHSSPVHRSLLCLHQKWSHVKQISGSGRAWWLGLPPHGCLNDDWWDKLGFVLNSSWCRICRLAWHTALCSGPPDWEDLLLHIRSTGYQTLLFWLEVYLQPLVRVILSSGCNV